MPITNCGKLRPSAQRGRATLPKETIMGRKYIDCREFPSDSNCSVAIAADTDQELLEAAVQHAVSVHKHEDTREFRDQLKQLFKEGTPPIERPVSHAL
jgi:predicted small metal-binding protein